MKFVEVADPKFDPEPEGFRAVDNPQFDAEPEKIGPGETFALNATNVFGAAPAIGGALQYLVNGKSYSEVRDAYRARIEQANAENPKAAIAGKVTSIVPEAVLGGAAGKIVAGGAKLAGVGSKAATFANNSPLIASVLEGIGGGAAYGAASGTGEALSKGEDILPHALEGAAGGALIGGAFGTVAGGIGKAARGAVEREEKAIVKGALSGSESKAVREDVVSLLRKDPDIKKIVATNPAEALPVLREKLAEITAKRGTLLEAIDAGAGVSLGKFAKLIDTEVSTLAKQPLTEAAQKELLAMKESVLKTWAPEELRIAIAQATKKGGPMESELLAKNLTKKLDDVRVPSKAFTELQESGRASEAGSKLIGNAIKSHVEESAGKGAAEKIAAEELTKLNRDYSALSAITGFIGRKPGESEAVHGLDKLMGLFTHHGPIGAAIAAASGHPIPAAILAAPALAKKGTQILAWLQREAATGNKKAIRILESAETAKTIGTAGAGSVGNTQSGTLATMTGVSPQ